MQDRRTYSDEVKIEALKMIKEQGLSLAEVGKRLSVDRESRGKSSVVLPDALAPLKAS